MAAPGQFSAFVDLGAEVSLVARPVDGGSVSVTNALMAATPRSSFMQAVCAEMVRRSRAVSEADIRALSSTASAVAEKREIAFVSRTTGPKMLSEVLVAWQGAPVAVIPSSAGMPLDYMAYWVRSCRLPTLSTHHPQRLSPR